MLEPNIYGLWAGKQVAKGTTQAVPSRRFVQVGGDFNLNRDDGEERYSDLTKYGGTTDWVNSLTGAGEPAIEATPTELAWLLWVFHGAETVTAVAGPPASSKHSFVPALGLGHYSTWYRRIGQTDIQRDRYNDTLITRVQIEGSTANKAVRITPRLLSLDPAEVRTSDPAGPTMPGDKTFLFTDGTGAFEIDTVVQRGESQFTVVLDEDLSPVYGDDTLAHDVVSGNAQATIAASVLFDDEGVAEWNRLVYGSAAPVAGTKPIKATIIGSYEFSLKQRTAAAALNGREFAGVFPGVKWAIPDAPGPNIGGGSTEIALAGSMRPVAGQSPYTLDVFTDPAVVAFAT